MKKTRFFPSLLGAAAIAVSGLSAGEAPLAIQASGRRAFFRNEEGAALAVELTNSSAGDIEGAVLSGTVAGIALGPLRTDVPAGRSVRAHLPLETRLRTGTYPALLTAEYRLDGAARRCESRLELRIGPARDDDPFDIGMWLYDSRLGFKLLRDIGFNTGFNFGYSAVFFQQPLETAAAEALRNLPVLDDMLCSGFSEWDLLNLNTLWQKKHPRVGRDGRAYGTETPNLDASDPAVQAQAAAVLERFAAAYRDHPAFAGVDINSEVRDTSRPSFAPHSLAAYRRSTGKDIPPEVDGKLATPYSRIRDFPVSRVVPEDDPLLTYYRWFWREGDGWNPLQTLCGKAIRQAMGRPVKTYFAPATRVPPLWGSGGEVDAIGNWFYAYPDPINIGVGTDELFAMARGNPRLKVTSETQIICYRSATAQPERNPQAAKEQAWTRIPNAQYITLAPDLLSIAVWTQISRRVDGIAFHGADALVTNPLSLDDVWGYRCTNQATRGVLERLLKEVVRPLGPALKRVPERRARIAVLESFASAVFAHRCTWGWTGWAFDLGLILQYGNLQPGVVYEEEILRDGFGGIKVLVMPHCEVLTEPVFRAVAAFQDAGGVIVGDDVLVPGITPDIVVPEVKRSGDPERDAAAFRETGLRIRKLLSGDLEPYIATSSPDIVTHVRSDGAADYLFAVNDKRTFGDYFGPYRQVMEKGLPNSGTVSVARRSGAVYDAVRHAPVEFTCRDGHTTIPVDLGPAEGRLLILMPRPVRELRVQAPAAAPSPGGGFEFTVAAYDDRGQAIGTILPLEVAVASPDGDAGDSRPAALVGGRYRQSVVVPLNVGKGDWRITVRDLASGIAGTAVVAGAR